MNVALDNNQDNDIEKDDNDNDRETNIHTAQRVRKMKRKNDFKLFNTSKNTHQ